MRLIPEKRLYSNYDNDIVAAWLVKHHVPTATIAGRGFGCSCSKTEKDDIFWVTTEDGSTVYYQYYQDDYKVTDINKKVPGLSLVEKRELGYAKLLRVVCCPHCKQWAMIRK